MRTTTLNLLAAAAISIAGCQSHTARDAADVGDVADLVPHNRLLIRMSAEENVYNGIAAERAVYSGDFRPGTAELNPLGAHRVDMLIDATRGARGQITVLRGDESGELYNARIETVRRQFVDAGIDAAAVVIGPADHVAGSGGVSSERAVLTHIKMMGELAGKKTDGGTPDGWQPSSATINFQKGQ